MRLSPFISFYAGFLGVLARSSRLIRRGKAAVALMLRGAAHEPVRLLRHGGLACITCPADGAGGGGKIANPDLCKFILIEFKLTELSDAGIRVIFTPSKIYHRVKH